MAEKDPQRRPDSHRRFVFEHLPVRGELVHLDQSWRRCLENSDYPAPVRALLGEAMAASVLLASILKFDGVLTLQLTAGGPVKLLVAQCSSDREVRALAKWRGEDLPRNFAGLTGGGRLAITIEPRDKGERYQGLVPMEGASLAACLEQYFARSVQLPTRLWLTAGPRRAAGLLLQRLPEAAAEAGAEDWRRLQRMADTVTGEELAGLPGTELLRRLFAEDDVRVFEPGTVEFSCTCSRDRVVSTLRMLGRDEIQSLVEEQGQVEVRCEFCNAPYRFDAVDAEALFLDLPGSPGSPTLH